MAILIAHHGRQRSRFHPLAAIASSGLHLKAWKVVVFSILSSARYIVRASFSQVPTFNTPYLVCPVFIDAGIGEAPVPENPASMRRIYVKNNGIIIRNLKN